ncbi:flagellar hook protein FlgE [Acidovorax lacteus]|uniref:Flagellar hook protein FlgE n=1 Tax=Acidovorax lacteus TaxID=1924988 RepID=A0ABP8KXG4_9BURK
MGFQQGLSGLNAASKNLDVIGHNIANSNTVGFKSSRAEFAEMVASAIGQSGGSNAGIGVEVSNIAQQFTQGNLTITGNSLDVAINGNGFFTLTLPDGTPAYTRAGNFKLDKVGNMVTNDGAKVMGYSVDPVTGQRTSTEPVPMVFPTAEPIPAKQTSKIFAAFNLDARAPDAAGDPAATPPIPATPRTTYGTSINVYDSQGVAKPVSLYFEKNGNNTWDVYDQLDDPTATPPVVATPVGQITFDNSGAIVNPAPTPPGTEHLLTLSVTPSPPNPNGLPAFNVDINLDKVTQFGTKFAVSNLTQDGYTAGQLTGINIENNGMIMTRYSNGVTRSEGQLALSSFRNTQGLAAVGGNNWVETFESGQPVRGTATDGNFGSLRSGALEDSNVDLTAELVNMMTAQRTYQANAQTIKTQDQVMSTLVNLR